MNPRERKTISRRLSLVLRHRPESIGIELDEAGWVSVDALIAAFEKYGHPLSFEQLIETVETNDKQRFAFNEDRSQIRANQGHSVEIDLGYQIAVPPGVLLHGTSERALNQIRNQGLIKKNRHHVHLHEDEETSLAVGQRHGKPVLLQIRAAEMATSGHEFFVTPNQVWLTEHVPPEFIDFPSHF